MLKIRFINQRFLRVLVVIEFFVIMHSIVVLEKIDVFVSVQNSEFGKIPRKFQMDIMFRIFMTIYVVKRKIGEVK